MPAKAPTVSNDLKSLQEHDVRLLFEEKIYDRGIKYFEQGRIVRPLYIMTASWPSAMERCPKTTISVLT